MDQDRDRDRDRGGGPGGGGGRNQKPPEIEFVDPDLNIDLDDTALDPFKGAGINPYGTGGQGHQGGYGVGMRPGSSNSRPDINRG